MSQFASQTPGLVVARTAAGWKVTGEIDAHSVRTAVAGIRQDRSDNRGAQRVLDLSGVSFIDSTGLVSLVDVANEVGLVVGHPSSVVVRLMAILGWTGFPGDHATQSRHQRRSASICGSDRRIMCRKTTTEGAR